MIHGGTVGDKGLSSLGVFYFVDAWMAFGVRPSDACGGWDVEVSHDTLIHGGSVLYMAKNMDVGII